MSWAPFATISAPPLASGIMRGMTNPKRARSALVFLFLLAFLAAACGAASLPHPMIGHTAADISAEYIGGKGPRTLKEALGKVVVLDFWATWCNPCKASFPAYARMAEEFRGDVVVIGVSVDDPEGVTKEKLLAFAAQAHATFPILWDKDGSTAAVYAGAKHLPSTFVIDRSGTVRHLHQGYGSAYPATIAREVKELLAEVTSAPALAAISVWKPEVFSCETEIGPLAKRARADCKDDACRKDKRVATCAQCLLTSCCAEEQVCFADAYPPASASRADAASCHCRAMARLFAHRDAETRCAQPNDFSRAEATCAAAHCADACAYEVGGPPP